jgi:3-oxoacyl-[acyl-carrier protein] reductase
MENNRRVALVTGAGRGIGRAIALALAAQGWAVGINYRSQGGPAEETCKHIEQAGGQAVLLPGDISQAEGRQEVLNRLRETWPRLDLLVNNAGMAPRQRADLLAATEASYDEVMAVNLKGPYFLTQQVAREMIRLIQTGMLTNPKIINIGSLSAYTSSTDRPEYCLSKAGLSMLTKLFADRLAEYGILVYEIQAGIIATDMTAGVKEKYDRLIAQGLTPIARWGQPEEVARAVTAIAEGALPFSTGEIIHVDGGFHLRRL